VERQAVVGEGVQGPSVEFVENEQRETFESDPQGDDRVDGEELVDDEEREGTGEPRGFRLTVGREAREGRERERFDG